MIDAKEGRVLELMSEVRDNVPVALLPDRLRMERRKAPILPPGEDDIRRGTPGHAQDKRLSFPPDIVAMRMDPEGKIEIEVYARAPCMLREYSDLLMGYPLDVEMVAPGPLVIISLREDAVTEGPSPRRPGGALPLARGPEAGVVLDLRMGRNEPPKIG
jgi:hypothetical protein